jgi:hypothetical protein
MSKFEKVLVVTSRGRGSLHIQQHDWSVVQRRLSRRGSSISVDDLLQFAEREVPRGRQIVHVELAYYVFDEHDNPTETGRRRYR